MKLYKVAYEVEVEAESQQEAADLAWETIAHSAEEINVRIQLLHCPAPQARKRNPHHVSD